jgi:hypothetical protein
VHDSGLNVSGRCLEVLDLRRRDHDIDDAARGWLALPELKVEFAHDIVDLLSVVADVDTVHLPVIVANFLGDRGGRGKAQRGEGDTEELHDDRAAQRQRGEDRNSNGGPTLALYRPEVVCRALARLQARSEPFPPAQRDLTSHGAMSPPGSCYPFTWYSAGV